MAFEVVFVTSYETFLVLYRHVTDFYSLSTEVVDVLVPLYVPLCWVSIMTSELEENWAPFSQWRFYLAIYQQTSRQLQQTSPHVCEGKSDQLT